MKRLIFVALVAAFIVAVPVSHLLMAGPPDPKKICHVSPASPAPADGFFLTIPVKAVPGHLNHGDCDPGTASAPNTAIFCTCP